MAEISPPKLPRITNLAFVFKVLRRLMAEVLQDKASVRLLQKVWQDQREQPEAAVPVEALFQMDESQARANRSLSEHRPCQGIPGTLGAIPHTFIGVVVSEVQWFVKRPSYNNSASIYFAFINNLMSSNRTSAYPCRPHTLAAVTPSPVPSPHRSNGSGMTWWYKLPRPPPST